MADNQMLFLKLGGSLLTDKTQVEAVRHDVLVRICREIAAVVRERSRLRLVIGHGSGSYGHVAAAKHGTQRGVRTVEQWMGFCEVSDSALRLNALVRTTLLEAGVPVLSIQPSASTICNDGEIAAMATEPVIQAVEGGLTPLLHGDVAFDRVKGGAIVSTEQVLGYLAKILRPRWFLLAGNTPGVLDGEGRVIPQIRRQNLAQVKDVLGGSEGTDVTGGMAAKVQDMLNLVQHDDTLRIRIFSGLEPDLLSTMLRDPQRDRGTLISA